MNEKTDKTLSEEMLKTVFTDPAAYRPYLSMRRFQAGFFLNMDPTEKVLYIFMQGRFNVYGLQSDGTQFLFRSCEAVMLIGENELIINAYQDLHSMYQMAFSLEMLTDCTVVMLDYRKVIPQLLADVRFLNVMCHSLVEKTLHFGHLEMNSATLPAEVRVAQYLLSAADGNGRIKGNQSIVAEQLRMSYRHLHRILKKFVENGWIARESASYRILDAGSLRKVNRDTFFYK